ncbi:hypothetical protein K438DRAFT_540765 [Mycena galopus ATCC 62051]|nr:hypothetical protein K438DRAFT_540765 [Mycena galopus ATCC 62051]
MSAWLYGGIPVAFVLHIFASVAKWQWHSQPHDTSWAGNLQSVFEASRLAFSKLLISALKFGFLKTLPSRLCLDLTIVSWAPFPPDSQDSPIKSTWTHSLTLAQN